MAPVSGPCVMCIRPGNGLPCRTEFWIFF